MTDGHVDDRGDLGQKFYHLARAALKAGQVGEAIELLRTSALAAPHFKTCELLGEQLVALGQTNDGILHLAAAIGLNRNQSRPRFLLAGAIAARGDVDDALQLLDEALALNPDYKAARELRTQLLDKAPPAQSPEP